MIIYIGLFFKISNINNFIIFKYKFIENRNGIEVEWIMERNENDEYTF